MVADSNGAADSRQLAMQHAVRCILAALGEDVSREGLLDTPKRVAKAFIAMTEGYRQDPGKLLSQALFNEPIIQSGAGGLVLVRDIDFAAISQATLLPFYGRAHIAYLPASGVVLGLSKLARLTKLCAKRLQSQHSLGLQLLHVLQAELAPAGAVVVLQARHLSYTAQQPPQQQLTAAASGCFAAPAPPAAPASSCKVAEVAAAGGGGPCLQEVLELLGLPVEAESVQLIPDAADPEVLLLPTCNCSSSSCGDSGGSRFSGSSSGSSGHGGSSGGGGGCARCGGSSSRRLEPSILRGFSASAAAAAGGDGGVLDSPRAPVTPDPSENDDSSDSRSEQGSVDHQHADEDLLLLLQQPRQSSSSAAAAAAGVVSAGVGAGGTAVAAAAAAAAAAMEADVDLAASCSMEAAMQLLLAEAGVDNVNSAAVQMAIRKHVLALLAATSGYHQEQPSRPCCSSSSSSNIQQQAMLLQEPGSPIPAACSCSCSSGHRTVPTCTRIPAGSSSSSSNDCHEQQQQQHKHHQPGQYERYEHHISFVSQCEHHMLPFHGTAHITYLLPASTSSSSSSCGSSSSSLEQACQQQQQQQPLSAAEAQQLVNCYTRRLQVQERITAQVAAAVQRLLQPHGVMVVIRAVHMCMVARGVENHAGSTVTRAALGVYEQDAALRCDFLRLLNKNSSSSSSTGLEQYQYQQQQQQEEEEEEDGL